MLNLWIFIIETAPISDFPPIFEGLSSKTMGAPLNLDDKDFLLTSTRFALFPIGIVGLNIFCCSDFSIY